MTHITVIPPSSPPAHSNAAWNLAPHLESEITSLAAICEVKQPQRQPLNTLEEDEGDEESDDNEESEDVGPLTNCTASLAPSDNKDGMKRRFLDTLAEILCYKKYAMYVTCTSLQEWNSRAIITVARNAKWEKRDTDLLTDLVTLMEGLAAGEPLQGVQASSLLRRLSVYYAPRLRYHVKQLLHLVQGKDKVKAFIPFCDEFLSQRITPVELVLRIERIHHDTDLYSAVRETYPPKVLERLVGELYFIRRPFIAQKIFCAAASRLESFQAVTFKLLEGFEEKAVPPDHSTCARFPVAPRSRGKLESTLQKSKWVHAEMRMVFYILGCDNMSRQFPYLGISKKTCFSCGHILQSLDIFSTRANHGKVYPRWTLPSTAAVSQDSLDSLHRATRGLADALCTEAAIDRGIHMDAVKESTITTPVAPVRIAWSPFNTVPPDSRFAAREAGFLRAIMGSGHMSDTNNSHHSSTEDESPSYTETELSQADITKPAAPQCAHCHENSRSLTACSKCDSIFYCDSDCREAHWPKHKFTCRLGRPIDEADMLVLACQEDQVQIDEDVALAFGFRSFSSARNWQILSHIYTKLIMKYGVNDDELRRAWQTNSLREFLLHRCAQLPRHDVAAELAWIKSHEELAANAILGFDKVMESMKRQLLDPSDWNTAFPDLVPRVKLDAFVFFCQILNGHIPDVDEDNWISLGFCTTADEAALQTLSRLYAKLIRECKFQEFWKAMEDSKMVQLFEKYRLGRAISRLRNFQTLMCDIGKWHESVWELKRFTRISGADPMQAVVADYGFGHCATGQQQEHLRQIYRSYFSRGEDEMSLHRACIEGRLYSFLESVLGPLDVQPGLLSNPYPLECGDHMGMVVEVAILCPESAVEQVEELRRRRGEEGVLLTIPDESDLDMQYCLRQRAGFLGEPINQRITRIGNTSITQWSTR